MYPYVVEIVFCQFLQTAKFFIFVHRQSFENVYDVRYRKLTQRDGLGCVVTQWDLFCVNLIHLQTKVGFKYVVWRCGIMTNLNDGMIH